MQIDDIHDTQRQLRSLALLRPTIEDSDVAAALSGTPACISMFGA